jgi:hypothetical protein
MFTKNFDSYACDGDEITCDLPGGLKAVAKIEYDPDTGPPDENSDCFWPTLEDVGGDINKLQAKTIKANKVMRAWLDHEWCFVGVCVMVYGPEDEETGERDEMTEEYDHALWGIDCNYPDSDNSYLMEVANDLLADALRKLGEDDCAPAARAAPEVAYAAAA